MKPAFLLSLRLEAQFPWDNQVSMGSRTSLCINWCNFVAPYFSGFSGCQDSCTEAFLPFKNTSMGETERNSISWVAHVVACSSPFLSFRVVGSIAELRLPNSDHSWCSAGHVWDTIVAKCFLESVPMRFHKCFATMFCLAANTGVQEFWISTARNPRIGAKFSLPCTTHPVCLAQQLLENSQNLQRTTSFKSLPRTADTQVPSSFKSDPLGIWNQAIWIITISDAT